ncbi:MAG: hypothetical protein K0Q95_244 [Bacteroidota bacterium]|jgi:hypothetical protein|nr:hypothetical protein [Bacteroidota bacterium]
MNKTFRVLEILWLVMGCIGVLLCAFNIMAKDNRTSIFFLIFTFACGMMYAVRRRQRIKWEAAQEKQKEQKK